MGIKGGLEFTFCYTDGIEMAGKTFLLQSAIALSLFTALAAQKGLPLAKGARCSGYTDPHYTTFDGTCYDFQGTCRYVLAKPCKLCSKEVDWSVEAKNFDCGLDTTCLETIFVRVYGKEFVLLDSYQLGVNPAPPASPVGLPYTFHFGGGQYVTVTLVGNSITLTTDFGLTVSRSPRHSFEVLLPRYEYLENTCGLCGFYNNNGKDDLRLPDGTVTTDIDEFGNSWRIIDSCCTDSKVGKREAYCSPEKEEEARRVCSILASEVFERCHSVVDPKSFIAACTLDVCTMRSKDDVRCEVLQEYARLCRQNEAAFELQWRKAASCPLECPEGMEYQLNGPAETPTCDNRETNTDVDRNGIEGCFCPKGTVLFNSRCVDPMECKR